MRNIFIRSWTLIRDHWFKTRTLKEKAKTEQDKLHDDKEMFTYTRTSGISNLDLHVSVIPVWLMPSEYHVTKL